MINKCIHCGKEISRQAIRCLNCSYNRLSGKNHPQYKHGNYLKSKKHYCKECNAEISPNAKLCHKCSYKKNLSGSNGKGPWNKNKKGVQKGKRGSENHNWKGGKKTTPQGYIKILCPEHPWADKRGYVPQHRLVVEEYLGRYLKPSEIVHHRNKNKKDNRIENLEVFNSNIEHLQFHGIIRQLKKSKEKRNIIILLPLYGYVPSHSVLSLIIMLFDSMEYYNANCISQVDMYTPLCRTKLANQIINILECGDTIDAIFFCDQDHYFQSCDFINLIEKFCESDYDVLGAHYTYKDETQRTVAFNFDADGNLSYADDIKLNTGVVRVDGIGLGFCCMKPAFLRKMHYEYKGLEFMTDYDKIHNKFIGEDVSFFKKAKKLGAKIGIQTDIHVKHVGAAI